MTELESFIVKEFENRVRASATPSATVRNAIASAEAPGVGPDRGISRSESRGESRRETQIDRSAGGGESAAAVAVGGGNSRGAARGPEKAVPESSADLADVAPTPSVAPLSASIATTWVLYLDTTDAAKSQDDAKAASALLPEPAVPTPDPNVLTIPADKVRQLVRRPATPRCHRPRPLQKIEILPRSDSRPPTRGGSAGKAKDKQRSGRSGVVNQKGKRDDKDIEPTRGEKTRAESGALKGNPYRWVVSIPGCGEEH